MKIPDAQRYVFGTLAFLLALVAAGAAPVHRDAKKDRAEVEAVFSNTPIFRIAIDIPKAGMDSLRQNPRKYVAATVREGDKVYKDVAIHLKGHIGSFRPVDDKPGLTLNFGKLEASDYFHGFRKFHLNNSVQDPTYLSELICGEVFRGAGVPAARVAYALVEINGRKRGLYVLKESFEKEMLSRYFKNTKGNLYGQSDNCDIADRIAREEGEGPADWADLRALTAAVREPDAARRWTLLQERLDVERFISFMAVEVMLCHWDGYTFARKNYRIYHDLDTDRILFFPHDLDQMMQNPNLPVVPGANGMVAQAILRTPEARQRYVARFGEIYTNVFQVAVLTNRIAQLVKRLAPELQAYDPELARQFAAQSRNLAQRIVARSQSLARQLQPVTPPAALSDLAGATWEPVQAQNASILQKVQLDGNPMLYIKSYQSNSVAAWRVGVNLAAGKYQFSGRAKSRDLESAVMPRGAGGGLNLAGRTRKNSLQGTQDWTRLEEVFEVAADASTRVMCELRAHRGEIWFDLKSLKLERVK